MSGLRRHAGLLALLALAAPLVVAFCWHDDISTLGDDSVSYVTLARWLSPFAHDAISAPWVPFYSHFPPIFPMLLAITGGAWNFFVAHMVVAACALGAIPFVYAYGASRLGSPRAGLGLALVFLLLPTAWISALSILSEPLYLAISLAALIWYARSEGEEGAKPVIVPGLLVGAAVLTRAAGIALLAACAAHVAIRARQGRAARRDVLPLLIAVALQLAWIAIRPAVESKGYQLDLASMLRAWIDRPSQMAEMSWNSLSGGWIATFAADSHEPAAIQAVLGGVALLGLAGAVRGAMRNRVDSWYVLASVAMLVIWVFAEDNQRRLLYPVVPLLLCHAAEMLAAIAARLRGIRSAGRAMLAGAALVALLSAPATLLVARKAADREPLIEGSGYSLSSITPYYTIVNVGHAGAIAWRQAAVLSGLEAIGRVTPRDARVMWMRPEYVAILGRREAVPWYYAWDRATLAREVERTGTTHMVVARIFKADLAGRDGDAFAALVLDTPGYLHPAFTIVDPTNGNNAFMLLEVDREALARALGRQGPGKPR